MESDTTNPLLTARPASAFVFTLDVALHGIPTVWRRVSVPSTIRLSRLHDVLQTAFGWTDTHLHDFTDGAGDRYGVPHPDDFRTAGR